MVQKIISHMKQTGEWGEFFPATLSPFAYDETPANEWHPLSVEEAKKLGYRWQGEDTGSQGKETMKWSQIPDSIKEAPETILKEVLACQDCSKNYRIQKQELEYYRAHEVPLPRFCPNCRHKQRWSRLNPKKLWQRQCTNCTNQFESTYAPDRPEQVLCETCYLQVIS